MLRERKLTGVEKFFTIAEQRMLQFTLPLFEQDGRQVASMKTIQVFILNVKDFQTAVDYLSNSAGMQQCHINKVLQSLRGVSVPQIQPAIKPQKSPDTFYMRPPSVPLNGRPMRPQSQTTVDGQFRHSPSELVYRSHTARPDMTLVPGYSSQNSSTPGTAFPSRGRTPSQANRYWSSPFGGHMDPRRFFVPSDTSHPRRLLSTGPGAGILREVDPLYLHPLKKDPLSSPPLDHEIDTSTVNVPDEHYHGRFHGRTPSQLGRMSLSAPRIGSDRTYSLEGRPLSRPSAGRPASRPSPSSDCGVPIRIQVLSLPDQSKHSRTHAEIQSEFTLHLLPSTKIFELCLHAASYIRREYCATVDGRALAAQSMDGTLFEDQDSLSDEILQGETLILVERRPLSTARSATANPSVSGIQPSHPERRLEAGHLDRSQPALPRDPPAHAFDETDQVPPRRSLPFRSVNTPALPSATAAARSPLSEKPGLVNADARSRANRRLAPPASQDARTEPAATKQPKSSQKKAIIASRRPASSASRRRLDPGPGAVEPSEPQISARRPKTSLGISRKRKAISSDEGVPVTTPAAIGSLLSNDEAIAKELATTACMSCKNKHRKCDRSKPACGPCLKDNRLCTYANVPTAAATGQNSKDTCNRPDSDTVTHPTILGSQTLASPPVTSDALTQTCHPTKYRDNSPQTQGIEQGNRDVEMNDVGTDPYNLYTDASTETERCDELWVPFSQCAQVVLWASNEYEKHVQKAAGILRTTDPSQDDYRDKVAQAAVYGWEFENGFRERFEQSMKR